MLFLSYKLVLGLEVTRDMTLHYINDPRTIVLAVLPANQDMSVSDSLQLARQVDPNGTRSSANRSSPPAIYPYKHIETMMHPYRKPLATC